MKKYILHVDKDEKGTHGNTTEITIIWRLRLGVILKCFHLLLKCYYFPLPPKKVKRNWVGNISNSRCGKEIGETRGPPGQCFSN